MYDGNPGKSIFVQVSEGSSYRESTVPINGSRVLSRFATIQPIFVETRMDVKYSTEIENIDAKVCLTMKSKDAAPTAITKRGSEISFYRPIT